jgi:hypothetical protein
MKRAITTCCLVAAGCLMFCATAGAQTAGRRPVRRASGVTGVDLGLEGALEVPRGGTLRWLMTAYEVVGLRDLRPAPRATISVATSFDPADSTEVTTDDLGRAVLSLTVPADAPDSFRAVIRVRSASEVQRRFELSVTVTEPRTIAVLSARTVVRPRGRIHVAGLVRELATSRPVPDEEVRLTLRDSQGRQLGAPVIVRTDSGGLYARVLRVPEDVVGGVTVRAEAGDDEHLLRDEILVRVADPQAPPMLVSIAPAEVVVHPGQRVPVDVVLRTPSGMPIPGAQVLVNDADEHQPRRRAVTDERGRAGLEWIAPDISTSYSDRVVAVTATREGHGQATGTATVRVTTAELAAAIAVEGGALVPSLGGRVWVRVTGIDGRPVGAGVPVEVQGSRLGSAGFRGVTDADGVATLEVSLSPLATGSTDRCGGEDATAIQVLAGPPGTERATVDACLPLDPDGAARVRATAPLLVPGQQLRLEITRAPEARGLPVSVSVLLRIGSTSVAVASRVVPASATTVEIELPADVVGRLDVRARPLHGAERREVRGGSTAVWVLPSEPFGVDLNFDPAEDTARIELTGRAQGEHSAYLVALPIDEARSLADMLERAALGPLEDLRRPPEAARAALLTAALAATVSRDVAAPAVLRPGEGLVPVPAPQEPVALGLLRDPWRSQARFVTGRLALIFQAIEQQVARALPDRIDDVAVRDGQRWDFNSEIVESVANSGDLGSGGATGLGGEPLTIDALQRLDRAFTYDNVARRITRERLFRIVVALRQMVIGNGFDLPWARRGDPSTWLRGLVNTAVPGGQSLRREDLVDGWGRPFELRRAAGGRTRFDLVAPLGGWEVVSLGPDGAGGTGDDIWDPTARVLPEGCAYAEAVGEDVLVARLRGVELGRATVEMLQNVSSAFRGSGNGVPSAPEAASGELARELWTTLPPVIEPDADALALRRPAHPGDGALGEVVRMPGTTAVVPLGLDDEPRTWGLVAAVANTAGGAAVGLASAVGGAPLIVEGRIPRRLHTNEPVVVDLELTNVTARPVLVTPGVRSEGSLRARSPEPIQLAAGAAGRLELQLEAHQAGRGTVEVTLNDAQGEPLRQLRFTADADEGMRPVRVRDGGVLAGRSWRTRLEVPRDAVRPTGRVVVLTPRALAADPDLADVRRRDPALLAWSETLNGHSLDPDLRAAMLRAQQPDGTVRGAEPVLSTACAVIAWSAAGEDDEDAAAALARARDAITASGPMADDDGAAGEIRAAAAMLAALAPGGVPELADETETALDPVARITAELRPALRRAIHTHPEEPSLLARAAAALLLADPRDGHGRAMLDRAASRLVDEGARAGLVAPSEARDQGTEAVTATLALAVAAHQAGRGDLAQHLLQAALARENVVTAAGGETVFWLLAAAAYGVMGTGTPEVVTVDVGGSRRTLDLTNGSAVVPFEIHAGRSAAIGVERVGGPALLVRGEVVMGREFEGAADGPLGLELAGDPGSAGDIAALELVITARRAVVSPVIDLQLPAGVDARDGLLDVVQGASGVRAAEPRRPGFLRVWLHPLAEGTMTAIPLPVRWSVRGQLRGLGAMAYPASEPAAMTVLPPAALDVR